MDINVILFRRFTERFDQLSSRLPALENVEEHQSGGLYFRLYLPAGAVSDVILIYHGGGVNLHCHVGGDKGLNVVWLDRHDPKGKRAAAFLLKAGFPDLGRILEGTINDCIEYRR